MGMGFESILLSDAQSGAVSAVPPQKKSAQIGHLAAENRKQLWVCAARPYKVL